MNGVRRFVGLSKKGLLPTRQRGNISLLMLGMAFVFIACAVLALDTGRLYLERQRLQTQADMAALELQAKARFDSSVTCDRDDIAFQAAVLNGFSGRTENVFLDSGDNTGCSVTLTTVVPDSLVANLALLWPGSGFSGELTLSATAYAQLGGPQWVTFSGSGSLLDLDTNRSLLFEALLGELLGSSVDLNVLSQSGLASTSISLLDLAYGLGLDVTAASVNQLLDAQVTMAQLIDVAMEANQSGLSASAWAALSHLSLNASPDVRNNVFELRQILRIDDALDEQLRGLESELSLGALLDGAIYVANKARAVSIDGLALRLDPLLTVGLTLDVIQAPVIVVGPAGCIGQPNPPCINGWRTSVESAQLSLELSAIADVLKLATLEANLGVDAAGSTTGIARLESRGNDTYGVWAEAMSSPLDVSMEVKLDLLPVEIPLVLLTAPLNSLIGINLTNAERTKDSYAGRLVGFDSVSCGPGRPPCGHTEASAGLAPLAASLGSLLSGLTVSLEVLPGSILGVILNPILGTVGRVLGLAVSSLAELAGLLSGGVGGVMAELTDLLDDLLADLGVASNVVSVDIYDVSPGIPTLADPTANGQ